MWPGAFPSWRNRNIICLVLLSRWVESSERLLLVTPTQSPTSLSEEYSHPDDHTRQTTDTPGFKLFTTNVKLPCVDGDYFYKWVFPDLWKIQWRTSHFLAILFLLSQQPDSVTYSIWTRITNGHYSWYCCSANGHHRQEKFTSPCPSQNFSGLNSQSQTKVICKVTA